MNSTAYSAQSASLGQSNVLGQQIESFVKSVTGGVKQRLFYSDTLGPKRRFGTDIDADCVLEDRDRSLVILSITHTKPDSKGHSNENKFQLKLGELWLQKTYDIDTRMAIVVGGSLENWLPWCLEAFKLFFDDAIFEWEPDFEERIKAWSLIPKDKHRELWKFEKQIREERESRISCSLEIPDSFLREHMFKEVVPQYYQKIKFPSEIRNDVLKRCMTTAYNKDGKEWHHFRAENNTGASLDSFWEKRTFFNPSEASVEMTLERMSNPFLGDIAEDIDVPNFMARLAKIRDKFDEFNNTKMSEDFVLRGFDGDGNEKYVYIQCKSSGGGLKRHGKNIQNRAKEQIARGVLYRANLILDSSSSAYQLKTKEQKWIWVGIVDGNWGTSNTYPEKYIHMLLLAGYDKIIPADSLIDTSTFNFKYPNPLSLYLEELDLKWDRVELATYDTTHDDAEHGKPSPELIDFDY